MTVWSPSDDEVPLFGADSLFEFLEKQKAKVKRKVDGLNNDELADWPKERYPSKVLRIEPLFFHFDKIAIVKHGNRRIDVRGRADWIIPQGGSSTTMGEFVKLSIPYSGAQELLYFKPQSWTELVHAEIDSNEIIVCFSDVVLTEQLLQEQRNRLESVLNHYTTCVSREVSTYNSWLEGEGDSYLQERIRKFDQRLHTFQKLGLELKKRTTAPSNISSPVVRKSLPTRDTNTDIEPCLDLKVYDEILQICENMARVMELSPEAFATIKEEHLRFHFLVQLNAVFEGDATGETFNLNGKTDIIVKRNGKNIFIAECKYWNGETQYFQAINQLFSYAAWRDTKLALIIFNRSRNLTAVLEKIDASTRKHPHYLGVVENFKRETSFRYRFKHGQDLQKECLLTVMSFQVPVKEKDTKNLYSTGEK